jgi:hypothetical protein
VRRAPSVRACLLLAAACLGACSDTFVVGREPPGDTSDCLSCSDKLEVCIGVAQCPAGCSLFAVEWEAYESCRCDACAGPCGGCPATDLWVTTIDCATCRSDAHQEGGACREAWLDCVAN